MLHLVEIGDLALDPRVVLAHHVGTAGNHLVNGGIHLRSKLVVLGLDVVKGNSHGGPIVAPRATQGLKETRRLMGLIGPYQELQ